MKLEDFHIVYFLGVGGIGMSAIARWFKAHGKQVYGYDRTATVLTKELAKEGIIIHYDDAIHNIPVEVVSNKQKCLVVYTPAIPKDHQEYTFLKLNGYNIHKRAALLGIITEKLFTVAVAGTHGKTTTSSMIAHILKFAGKDFAAFLGGITQNYNTNFFINKADNAIAVVEADEYDRSFLTLNPDIAVINSIDADHLDIYGAANAVEESFNDFAGKIKPSGQLFVKNGIELANAKKVKTKTFSLKSGDYKSENVEIKDAAFHFTMNCKGKVETFELNVPGYHNVENAIVSIAVAMELGIETEVIKKAIADFKGVKRRFEYVIKSPKIIFIDDYAHHPVEIEAFLKSVKALYPNKKITAAFQPHLFSRTRDFVDGFAESLSIADELILLDIYPARELPIPGITSEIILEKVKLKEKQICRKSQLIDIVKAGNYEVFLTIGAGDIDTQVEPIREILKNKYEV